MKKFLLMILLFSFQAFAEGENDLKKLSNERIIFRTNFGDIMMALYPNAAPKHTEQVLKLVKAGIYDGMTFHRLEHNFVLQINNHDNRIKPLTPEQKAVIHNIPAEFNEIPHRRGILSMARMDGDNNSAETSFSFLLADSPHLDKQYTAFGQVVAGMSVIEAIETIQSDASNKPAMEIIVNKAEVISDGNFSNMNLHPAIIPTYPDAEYNRYFLIFAMLAFTSTVIWPFVKTAWATKT